MSGDVQPRKRKDKKKKKDDGDFYSSNEDLNIHVHKEGGTGGNVCSKIVFFFLFSALIVLVGLIIKENQGLNELENIESESRFSQIFEGWVDDKSADDHDDHSPEVSDDDHDASEEDELEEDQSQDEEEELEDPVSRSEEVDETEEEPQSEQVSDEEQNEESEGNEESEETEDSAEPTETADSAEAAEKDDSLETQSDEQNIDSKESEETAPEVVETEGENEEDEVKEENENEVDEKPPEKGSSGVATKIGVGLALLTVAYNVFLRKRRPDVEKPKLDLPLPEEGPPPDLSRRNTLIPPPTLQEIEPDLPDVEIENEEYSEEEYSDDETQGEHSTVRDEYQELRSTYSRSLTPEGEFEVKDKHYEEDVLEDEEEPLEEEVIYEIYDEDEDEELLRRLEAKYGKLDKDVKVEEERAVNTEENKLRENIEAAERQLHENAAYANKLFEALLDQNPFSPRVLYGKGKALDTLAEEKQSNQLLVQALNYYMRALNSPSISDHFFVQIATRYIDKARFVGHYKKAITVHWQLIERFPHNVNYFNNLAVTYLTVNMVEDARNLLKTVLSKWPNDGFALVHYGFILKTKDNNFKDAVEYMTKGLQTKAPGVVDGRFYFHLGDALTRLGRRSEALKLYEEGVQLKVFKSKYQRSLYNIDRLAAKPWWEPYDLPMYRGLFSELQNNWKEIRKEGLSILNRRGYFEDESESLKDTGTWKQLELYARGHKNSKNCDKTPLTCSIIEKFPDAKGCRRGQTKFSVMHPGTHVWPHCGPTNCRLRIHLGLKVPNYTFIKVAEETRSWKEGEVLIFDDSFEHEVWHNGTGFRLVLIIDVWHPNLSKAEKISLSPI